MMAAAKDDTSGAYAPPIPRWGQPEDVAASVGFLLGDESTYISGTSIVIDGALTCWTMPTYFIYKQNLIIKS